jgi:16S rRNA (guanine527-N7)-methyltransferase
MAAKVLPDSEGLESILSRCGIVCEGRVAERVEIYLRLLEKWNQKVNLTGFRDRVQMLRELFAESFLAAPLLGKEDGPLLDVGSGAGFPGMALKVYRPDLAVYLLEPRRKRASFLEALRRELALEGVRVVCKRLEDCRPRDFAVLPQTVTLRGVAGVGEKLAWCDRLMQSRAKVVLFTSRAIWQREIQGLAGVEWSLPIQVPWSRRRLVVSGLREGDCST